MEYNFFKNTFITLQNHLNCLQTVIINGLQNDESKALYIYLYILILDHDYVY